VLATAGEATNIDAALNVRAQAARVLARSSGIGSILTATISVQSVSDGPICRTFTVDESEIVERGKNQMI
jgi:hypothetical protein